ncbi:MAG: radical SAM protein, partial [Thiocapsa sp.]
MRPVLIFPPLTDPSQPYSALPALTAFLRERAGFESVQIDANIGFVLDRLNGPKVREAGEKIRQRLEQLDEEPSLAEQQAVEYAFLISAALKGPMVERGIDWAVLGLRDPSVFADLGRLDRCKRLVDEALEIHSAVSYPIRIGFSNATAPDFTDPGELTAYAENTGSNPFIDFLASETLSRIEAATPNLVGISITYRTQVLPAVTLARLIRRRMPGVPVVLGGSIVSRWYDRIEDCPGVFDWCDYLIPFEGESALVALLGALAGERPLDRVPNLVYRENDRIRRNPVAPEEIDALPTPDYRGLPLERYLSPYPVLMLNTSRGCYWGKCHFCSVSPAMRRSYRARSTDLVHDDIVTLNARHGSTCIAFGDDCVAPATLAALARRLRERGPAISWQCEVRFEKALTTALLGELRDAGCVNLIFGLESYDPGVRERMGKGVQQREIDRILDDCRRLGIAFNLQFFFGFPGETRSEAEVTAGLVSREMHGAA